MPLAVAAWQRGSTSKESDHQGAPCRRLVRLARSAVCACWTCRVLRMGTIGVHLSTTAHCGAAQRASDQDSGRRRAALHMWFSSTVTPFYHSRYSENPTRSVFAVPALCIIFSAPLRNRIAKHRHHRPRTGGSRHCALDRAPHARGPRAPRGVEVRVSGVRGESHPSGGTNQKNDEGASDVARPKSHQKMLHFGARRCKPRCG